MTVHMFYCANCACVHSFNKPCVCVTVAPNGSDFSIVEPYDAGLLRFIRRHGCTYEDLPIGRINHRPISASAE